MEWVEAQGKTVDVAVEAALAELGLSSADEATVEVIQEPAPGFLGLGGRMAIVKVSMKPKRSRRRRRRGRGGEGSSGSQDREKQRKNDKQRAPSAKEGDTRRKRNDGGAPKDASKGGRQGGAKRGGNDERRDRERQRGERPEMAPIETQAEVAAQFLTGLLEAFGLEGSVATRVDGDILWIDVTGAQTEALVGPKGTVMQAVNELTRTVIQRRTFGAPRMRLDIAGYGERRREALRIYTTRLADRLRADGGEIMLEPMNAADRKVVHDTVVEIEGVRSYSEGEEPNRAVVLALEEGYQPAVPEHSAAEPVDDAAAEPVDDAAAEPVDDAGPVSDDDGDHDDA